ncbi:hypothetical protein CPB86DRAFT_175856 [Serendipita vermifera]|nr:hypothetical protein CPB86DRAFT_175856 [Serendipita vermifera]
MSLSVFKKYLQDVKPRAQEKSQPRQSDLPDLPNELWLSIFEKFVQTPLELVLYGTELNPRHIEQVHTCLTDMRFSTKRRVQVAIKKNKNILRLVCRSWKAIVDSIKVDGGQILDEYYKSSEGQLPVNTSHRTRLNMVYALSSGERIKFSYSHSISTLSLLLESWEGSTSFLHSLADILSFPKDVQVLALHIRGCTASKDLLNDIKTMSIPLTTLVLNVTNVDMLQIILNVSTLVTLLLSIPRTR